MAKKSQYTAIVLETYNRMFKASEPSLDFMNYIETTTNYVHADTGEKVVLGEHISLEEMHSRMLQIDVPFDKHFIDRDISEKIIDDISKEYKLTSSEKGRLRTQVYLGCAPTFKNNKIEKQI